jgi:hypothetical protein
VVERNNGFPVFLHRKGFLFPIEGKQTAKARRVGHLRAAIPSDARAPSPRRPRLRETSWITRMRRMA